eukprot:COSAG06_NODE_32630_length_503_cov_0.618812_1_plen_21_part_10
MDLHKTLHWMDKMARAAEMQS